MDNLDAEPSNPSGNADARSDKRLLISSSSIQVFIRNDPTSFEVQDARC